MKNDYTCPCCGTEEISRDASAQEAQTISASDLDVLAGIVAELLRRHGFNAPVHDPLFLMVRRMLETDTLPFVGVGVAGEPRGPRDITLDCELNAEVLNKVTRDIEEMLERFNIKIEHREAMRNLRGGIEYKILRPLGLPVPEYDDQDTFDKPSVLGLP